MGKNAWTALVPMRHHSERVPGKNYRSLAGRPLYEYILETLSSVTAIEQIVVDTDSPRIADGIRGTFPQVVLLDRPQDLRGGDVPMNKVLVHDVEMVASRFYLQTHSTNPLLKPATVERALLMFERAWPEHDSLFGVTRRQVRLWSADGKPINHNPSELLRTQDLPAVYEENSCLYLFEREGFLDRPNRIGQSPQMFEVPVDEALDIDEELDFSV
ncbi:MAG: acylneuraminate cytidylyltransferase family protein, partial [Anaerolineales bacterium]